MTNKKKKPMRIQRIEIISEIYTTQLLDEKLSYKQIAENNPELNSEQILKLSQIEKRLDFIQRIFLKLINNDWPWERMSPLIRAILINAANEFWYLEPKIVINEAVEITKMFFGTPEEDGRETIENRLYKYVNALLQNFYKILLKLESESR
ncbi:transcription anti-termination factor NusB [Mycoplasmopsis canis UFG4]|uniref:Transcription anti-termination factor NusB n=2 Tax=Mycoplasmopsis canis TaxID=29555 RepID=I1A4M1_9BACT|nr:transcription antitermination factor NusB [Mycoplasmopsis canis]AKF41360.1 antitermination protein NusB [Mycoplasmopsis canis]AMD81479.1 antitermination protein NusB [Mycoplasmopsis canis PG 14]EIE39502.1 transcription anti-termination factor NusB [Mycoplasmopsis canis PG 14]EIE39656.1 transcription anti-termination factor NusB [Mycoplasmopsis canis UF31]EIE41442.1 transcription anti-termination factor NusB [Mycoplasmopsis canis UFG4]